MLVGVSIFDLQIPHARSLKDRRAVVKSLRDRLRQRLEVSAAEVAAGDLHQRAKIAVAVVSSDRSVIERILEGAADLIAGEGDATLLGSRNEILQIDESPALAMPEVSLEEMMAPRDEEDT